MTRKLAVSIRAATPNTYHSCLQGEWIPVRLAQRRSPPNAAITSGDHIGGADKIGSKAWFAGGYIFPVNPYERYDRC